MKNKMLAIMFAIIAGSSVYGSGDFYPQTLIITSAAHAADWTGSFKARTAAGVEYLINQDPEDLETGDLISCLMYSNGTPKTIVDDLVVEYRYAGNFEKEEKSNDK